MGGIVEAFSMLWILDTFLAEAGVMLVFLNKKTVNNL